MTDAEFVSLKRIVRRVIGIDLDAYKPEQMRRRIDNFVQHRAAGNCAVFCQNLERDPDLVRDLADMMTINVTEFFRDPLVFENLRAEVLPTLLRQKSSLNIWSAGCSRGSEAYTVAMLLDGLDARGSHSIVASDIDKTALAISRQAGPYPPGEVKNVPRPLLSRYFKTEQGRYHLTDAIRHRVLFRQHNLLEEAFEKGFDLILCRNVMIYFTPEARKAVTQRFFDALKPGGMLLLGATEALMPSDNAGLNRIGLSLYVKPGDLSSAEPATRTALIKVA